VKKKEFGVKDPNGKEMTIAAQGLRVLGWAGGAAVGAYCGIHLLIPLFATVVVWWLGSKLLRDDRRMVLPAFSVQAGHCLWMSLGLLTANRTAVLPDLVIYVAGLLWLIKRPSAGPLCLLGAYQLASIGYNSYVFSTVSLGSVPQKGLIVHLVWRIMAIVLMVRLFLVLRRREATTPVQTVSS
jgi:hypothetical protein